MVLLGLLIGRYVPTILIYLHHYQAGRYCLGFVLTFFICTCTHAIRHTIPTYLRYPVVEYKSKTGRIVFSFLGYLVPWVRIVWEIEKRLCITSGNQYRANREKLRSHVISRAESRNIIVGRSRNSRLATPAHHE